MHPGYADVFAHFDDEWAHILHRRGEKLYFTPVARRNTAPRTKMHTGCGARAKQQEQHEHFAVTPPKLKGTNDSEGDDFGRGRGEAVGGGVPKWMDGEGHQGIGKRPGLPVPRQIAHGRVVPLRGVPLQGIIHKRPGNTLAKFFFALRDRC